jgi:hypothetical protein
MSKTTSKVFKEAYPRSVPLTEWTNKVNRHFVNSDLRNSTITSKVLDVLQMATKPLTIKQIEKRVYGTRLRTMNPSTHARKIVKKLIWDSPSMFSVSRESGRLELTWK